MMPVGPLMIEHRLIERMIAVFQKELDKIKEKQDADLGFVDDVVDFIRLTRTSAITARKS